MAESTPFEILEAFLRAGERREVRQGTVTRFQDGEVILDLDGEPGARPEAGRIIRSELTWRRDVDPAEIVTVGQRIVAEVIGVDPRTQQVLLSARACEDRVLRTFLLGLRPGDVVTGTVTQIHDFGVFVQLDEEPADNPTGMHGTGFLRIPELSWSHFEHPSDVVTPGQRVTAEVLDSSTRRGQVNLSLKSLQEDPFTRFAGRVGEVVSGRVTKIAPFGVFVRVADGIEGLLPFDDPTEPPTGPTDRMIRVGEEITVRIAEADPHRRRVSLARG